MFQNFFYVSNNSFAISNYKEDFSDSSIHIISRFEKDNKSWNTIESNNYFIFLYGHLYFENSNEINSKAILKEILTILENSNPESLEEKIGGGLFSLGIYSKKSKSFQIMIEKTGASPIFYQLDNTNFKISNNQFVLGLNQEADEIACIEFLKYGYLPFSQSLFKNINRILPGEKFNYLENKITITDGNFYEYPELENRKFNPDKDLDKLHNLFKKYFGKFKSGKFFLGLSGGYDSRLIAAFLQGQNATGIHFLNSDPLEKNAAEKASLISKIPLEYIQFPKTSPVDFKDFIASRFNNISSFEYSHVLYLQSRAFQNNPDFYFDGYIGDTILGGSYFESPKKGLKFILKYLLFKEVNNSKIKSKNEYIPFFYADKEGMSDGDLSFLISDEIKQKINLKIEYLLDKLMKNCKIEEDLFETWKHFTRARCMISMGPTGIQTKLPAACPFIDYSIRNFSLSLPKEWRHLDRLYNLYWKKYFPEYSKIPKSRTGAISFYGNFIYRIQHIYHTILKKIRKNKSKKAEDYFSVEDYINQKENQFLYDSFYNPTKRIPSNISEKMDQLVKSNYKFPAKFILRFASLNQYLRETL